MPNNPKAPGDREGHHGPARALAVSGQPLPAPDPPRSLPAVWRRRWVEVWSSPVASVLDPVSDLAAATRLFELYALNDELNGAIRAARPTPAKLAAMAAVTMGNLGDVDTVRLAAEFQAAREMYNANVTLKLRVAGELRQLENALCFSPRARLALGLAILGAAVGSPGAGAADDDPW